MLIIWFSRVYYFKTSAFANYLPTILKFLYCWGINKSIYTRTDSPELLNNWYYFPFLGRPIRPFLLYVLIHTRTDGNELLNIWYCFSFLGLPILPVFYSVRFCSVLVYVPIHTRTDNHELLNINTLFRACNSCSFKILKQPS